MTGNGFAELVDDRPGDGVFRVDRGVYTDPDVFEAELRSIFEGSWVYLAHESQFASPGDYITGQIGRQPVILNRRRDGGIGGLINSCAHRGALLTATARGNVSTFTCPYHGWCYDAGGRCIKVKAQRSGWPAGLALDAYDLKAVPRLESYRGFVFASLNAEVPALTDHLGPAAAFIDLLVDQSADGLEVLDGSSSYIVDGNWKLQCENGVDGYHVDTVHRNFASTVARRDARVGARGTARTEVARIRGQVETGCYDLGNGHTLIWAERASPEAAPIHEARLWLEPAIGPERWRWMCGRGRNLLLFPNVFLMDQSSTQVRIIRPLGPARTEVTVYCIAPVGESAEARAARLNKFRDFFLLRGLATPDDAAVLEDVQAGVHGRLDRWNSYSRGLAMMTAGADEAARELGIEPISSSPRFDHEALYLGQYRQWLRLLDLPSPACGPKPSADGPERNRFGFAQAGGDARADG